MKLIGIDGGLSGALCLFERDQGDLFGKNGRRVIDIIDMPVANSAINVLALRDWIIAAGADHAFFEYVTAMPSIPDKRTGVRRGMGATSAFNYGGAVGDVRTTVRLCAIPLTWVTPAVWMKRYGLKGGPDNKESHRLHAISLFPDAAYLMARKKDQNRADALLVANYGSERLISQVTGRAA